MQLQRALSLCYYPERIKEFINLKLNKKKEYKIAGNFQMK